MMQTGKRVEWIEEVSNASGIRYYLRSFSPPISVKAGDDYIIAYGIDITDTIDSKNALEELNINLEQIVESKTNENLELNANLNEIEKFVAIGELTMGIAHDLNSPLAAILIGAQNVRQTLEVLFHGLIHDCSPEELEFACFHAMSGDLKSFQSSLKAMKERNQMQALLRNEKGFSEQESLELADGLLKARVGIDETEKINRVIESKNQTKFLELMRHIYTIRQMVDTILDAANRSADVISDLRKFTKSAVQQREETINIAESVNSVLRVLGTNLKGNIDVHIDIPTTHELKGVPRDIFQIWSNVIKNALEALGEAGGDLWIRSVKEGDTLKIEFENNGPEIPKEFISKIFERFKSSKGKDNHGFGLNIVKKIADTNGWGIKVVSENKSTSFLFEIKA
jgi:signal transduction histidine kinase